MGVELLSGPPGSGKKEYIKEKISAYLKRGEDPSQITVISNSQVASENFHRFLLSETDSSKGIYTESVTSLSKRILRENYYHTDLLPGFRVISDFEKRLIVRNILRDNRKLRYFRRLRLGEGLVRELSNFIDRAGRSPGWRESAEAAGSEKLTDLIKITDTYHRLLKKLNLIDFTGLAENMLRLLETQPSIVSSNLLCVYQAEDLDPIAGEIILRLAERSLEAVISLDVSSGIYAFRGAEPKELRRKVLGLKGVQEIRLPAPDKLPSELSIPASSRDSEASLIVSHAASLLKNGVKPSEIAVIARSVGENTGVLTEAFAAYGINAVVSGGIGFFKEREVREVISFLEALLGKEEAEDTHIYRALLLSKIISVEKLDLARREALLKSGRLLDYIDKNTRKKYLEFLESFNTSQAGRLPQLIYEIIARLGLLDKASCDRRSSRIYGYLLKVVSEYSDLTSRITQSKIGFKYFMENIFELLSGFGKDIDIPIVEEEEAVRITTVQQAKGEKFKIVYLFDMVDGVFPREFIENSLLSAAEQKLVGLSSPEDRKRQMINEEKLFKSAKATAKDMLVYSYYTADNNSSPVDPSEFIPQDRAESIIDEINENINLERELLLKSAADLSFGVRELISEKLPPELAESILRINLLERFSRDSIHKKVRDGIPESFSASSLGGYSSCPALYFINNILRLPAPETIHQLFGTAVHRMLQIYHTKGEEIDLDKIAIRAWLETGLSPGFEARNFFNLAKKILKNYVVASRSEEFKVIKNEEKFSFTHIGTLFTGRLDRVDEFNNLLRVADYKTGKKLPATRGLLSAVKRGDNFQIPLYALAGRPGYFTIYRLREDAEKMIVTIDLSSKEAVSAIEEGWKHIAEKVDAIREGVFRPEAGPSCRTCYFARSCNVS